MNKKMREIMATIQAKTAEAEKYMNGADGKGNAYEHSVTADIRRSSNLYPEEEFYIGHTCEIKTKAYGVRESIISSISYKKDSSFISVKFGNMAVTLIEKLRKERRT